MNAVPCIGRKIGGCTLRKSCFISGHLLVINFRIIMLHLLSDMLILSSILRRSSWHRLCSMDGDLSLVLLRVSLVLPVFLIYHVNLSIVIFTENATF